MAMMAPRYTRAKRRINLQNKMIYQRLRFLLDFSILIAFALLTLMYVNRAGWHPWGSDTYGHLFKANILYDSIMEGRWFVNYDESWYNGVQPFRYWAPLPYYILALINIITKDIFRAFHVFIVFTFIIGGLGWLLWGSFVKRQNLALALALLWFFVPNNLRILFSEGNIPFVVVNCLLPYVMLFYHKAVHTRRMTSYLAIAFLMFIAVLSHAMLAAMLGIALFMLAAGDALVNKRYIQNLQVLVYAVLGIMCSAFWLYPALKGGIMSLDKEAVASVMRSLTYDFKTSLNPLLRFSNIEIYYYGLAFALTAAFGLLFAKKNEIVPFAAAILILLGTSKLALPVLEQLPLNQLFWMSRFTSIAMAMIIAGILLWKRLRKPVLLFILILLLADSAGSLKALAFNVYYPQDTAQTLDVAIEAASQRIAVLDGSQLGSFPSNYISYNSIKGVRKQVFGWAWQGAATSQNIMMLNTSLENGYFEYMFDRALELGADTLVIKKNFIKDLTALEKVADKLGYHKQSENALAVIYKYNINHAFGTSVQYEGMAIGRYSPNIVYMFPKFQVGQEQYLDNYSFEELKVQKTIFLSGFQYKNKKKAEDLVLRLSEAGVRVVIDATGMEGSFLGVSAEPITIQDGYDKLYYNGNMLMMNPFPVEFKQWKTVFLSGIESQRDYAVVDNKMLSYVGNKHNENLTFIGLNIPYYAFLTKDGNAIKLLENAIGEESFELPQRELVDLQITRQGDTIRIAANKEDVVAPIAALDAFVTEKGDSGRLNNLVHLKSKEIEIKIIYPHLTAGVALSAFALLALGILSVLIYKEKKMQSKKIAIAQ